MVRTCQNSLNALNLQHLIPVSFSRGDSLNGRWIMPSPTVPCWSNTLHTKLVFPVDSDPPSDITSEQHCQHAACYLLVTCKSMELGSAGTYCTYHIGVDKYCLMPWRIFPKWWFSYRVKRKWLDKDLVYDLSLYLIWQLNCFSNEMRPEILDSPVYVDLTFSFCTFTFESLLLM